MDTATTGQTIRLDYFKKGQQVVVTPHDMDRFMLSVQEAATACKVGHQAIRFGKQFEQKLLPRLAGWLRKHERRVRRGLLTTREGRLLFLVVRRQAECDLKLTDDLSDLDMEIAQDHEMSLISLDVLALPDVEDEVAESFIDSKWSMAFGSAK